MPNFKTACDHKAFALVLGASACFSAFYGLSTLDEMAKMAEQVNPSSSYSLHLSVLFQGIVFNGIYLIFCGPQRSLLVAEFSFAILVFGNIFSGNHTQSSSNPSSSRASQSLIIKSIYGGCGATLLWTAAPCCLNYIFVQHGKKDPSRSQLCTTVQHRKLWIGYLYAALLASRGVENLMRLVLTLPRSESSKGNNTSYFNMADCIQHRLKRDVHNSYLTTPQLHVLTISCAVLLFCGLYANKHHTVSPTLTKKVGKKSGKNTKRRSKVAEESPVSKVLYNYHSFIALPMMSYGLKEYFYTLHQNNHTLCLHEFEKISVAAFNDMCSAIAAVACIKVAQKFGHFAIIVMCFIMDNCSFGVHIMEFDTRNIDVPILFLLSGVSGITKGSLWSTLAAMLMELYLEDEVSSQIGMSIWYHSGLAFGVIIYNLMSISSVFQMFIPISISSAIIMATLEQKLSRKRAKRAEINNPPLVL